MPDQNQWKLIAVSALAIGVVAVGTSWWFSSAKTAATAPGTQSTKGKKKTAAAKNTLGIITTPSHKETGDLVMEELGQATASDLTSPRATSLPLSIPLTEPLMTDFSQMKFRAVESSRNYDMSLFAPVIPANERANLATQAKNAGNEFYKQKLFLEAFDMYTQAIRLKPDSAVFYSNRAACLANLGDFDGAVADCTVSLQFNRLYLKALTRRAHAYEKLDMNSESLKDYSVICVIEGFQNNTSLAATDRLLKKIGRSMAEMEFKKKKDRLPSATFISAYMDSFFLTTSAGAQTIIRSTTAKEESDKLVREAFIAIDTRNWETALTKINQALELKAFGSTEWEALAYDIRGTFTFLKGKVLEAGADFERAASLDPKLVDAIIKRASVYMETGNVDGTMEQLILAEAANSESADLYYHRGQVRFLTGDLAGAADDYQKAIELNNSFLYAYIQLGVSSYKMGDQGAAKAAFNTAARRFPENPEVFNYFGEILLDMQEFELALTNFDKSISLGPQSPLPYINKAILYVGWRTDIVEAEKSCRKAIAVDPLCDIAHSQLAQLLLQQNKVEEAIESFTKAVESSRTEGELMNAISCREAAVAQLYVIRNYPNIVAALQQDGGAK